MSRLDQPLLINNDEIRKKILASSELLRKLLPDDASRIQFDELTTQLELNNITIQGYFENETIKALMSAVETMTPNSFFQRMRRVWSQEYSFSHYQKIFFTLATAVLLTGAVLSREYFVLFGSKEKMEETGDTIQAMCEAGLTNKDFLTKLVTMCALLPNGMAAIFSLNKQFDFENLATIVNATGLDLYHNAQTPLVEINSWLLPSAYRQSWSCQVSLVDMVNENVTTQIPVISLNGHHYAGSLSHGRADAINGFPIEVGRSIPLTDPLYRIAIYFLEMFAFLAPYCIGLQQGSNSIAENPATNRAYGSTEGYERFGDGFRRDAYGAMGTISGFLALATLTIGVLIAHKIMSKCSNWSADHATYTDAVRMFQSVTEPTATAVVPVPARDAADTATSTVGNRI